MSKLAAAETPELATSLLATTELPGRRLQLHPQVALRPEPFGALAYHYDTRRLLFLRHRDMVNVVQALAANDSVAATLDACGIADQRRPAFYQAIENLITSGMLHDRPD